MVEIRRSVIVRAPLEAVWAVLRNFNGHERWHPAVASSEIEEGAEDDQVGAVRNFQLMDGGRIREQLLALSDVETSFTYCILEAPVFLHNYVANVRLRRVTDDETCLWEWRASFDPPTAEKDRLKRFVAEDIIEAGFRAFARSLASGPPIPAQISRRSLPVSGASGIATTAIILTRYGGPEVLEAQNVFAADPGPGEARIRQTAVGVNFIDVYCRRGSFDLVTPPGILGLEAAGVVESVGPGVSNVSPGDRVGYACAPPGAYTQIRTMRSELLVRIPGFLSDEAAAAVLLKGITASFLLHDVYAVRRGDIVLVHAAAGGVGQLLSRWAKALGATVIGAVSTEAKADQAKRVGCDHVIIVSREDFADAVMRLIDGKGAHVVYDAVGKDTFEGSIRALAPRGHLVSFGQASGDVGAYSIDKLASRSVTLSRPNYGHYTDTAEKLRTQTDRLFAALQSRILVAEAPRRYALVDARSAHADLEGRQTTGALVLTT
jgi:NADPH2:quinone reductase